MAGFERDEAPCGSNRRTPMKLKPFISLLLVALITTAAGNLLAQEKASAKTGALSATDVQKLVPPSFFYAGQTAPSQMRNAGGFRNSQGKLVLASLVDNSGYSTGVAAKYQGFVITETALKIGAKSLPAGAYGIGTTDDGKFVVTDVGAGEVFSI